MCGIVTILDIQKNSADLRTIALELAKQVRHRGPDWSGIYADDHAILAHERLAIVDVDNGAQPLFTEDQNLILAVNGEIYNHRELESELSQKHEFRTQSDCEVILHLYEEQGAGFLPLLNGIFAFVFYDKKNQTYLVARDHIGIIPLFIGWDAEGNFYIASEMKALIHQCTRIQEFPPGHYYKGDEKEFVRYYKPDWLQNGMIPASPVNHQQLREALEAAVKRQLMCDVPYGILLSGGLDSSIISAITAQYRAHRIETDDQGPAWWPQLHSFSIGLKGSPDLIAAQKVADHLGTIHHELHYTVQEGIDALSDVIYHIETFDVTTVRASTPMYLMSRKIKAMGIKMVLSGEGADEVFGGYLYFHKAPNRQEFFEETVRKVTKLHQFDCLRANKSMAAWGVEARVPFLDREFLDMAMMIDPSDKMIKDGRIEKHMLRQAFEGYLPDEVLWRQKEQFSDGVGYSWIDSLKARAEELVSDKMMEQAKYRFPTNTPQSKEAYWYRSIWEEHFPNASALACIPEGPSIACSSPTAIRWDKQFSESPDPSGRSVKQIHKQSNQ